MGLSFKDIRKLKVRGERGMGMSLREGRWRHGRGHGHRHGQGHGHGLGTQRGRVGGGLVYAEDGPVLEGRMGAEVEGSRGYGHGLGHSREVG